MNMQRTKTRALRAVALLAASLAIALLGVAPAVASQGISSFAVTASTAQAGGHPDLGMSFALDAPGQPEAAKDITVDMPAGVFGNPNAITRCASVDFALTRCPASAQAGWIELHANYQGNPDFLLGTAPIYDLEPNPGQTALFAFAVPVLDIPISIPVAVRTAGDFGLRLTVADITQLVPLASAHLTLWGFPADAANDSRRFAKGSPGQPAGCMVKSFLVSPFDPISFGPNPQFCTLGSLPAGIAVAPLINSPSTCTGPLEVKIEVETYQDPANPSTSSAAYPAATGCHNMTFDPVLSAIPTTTAADSPSGLDVRMTAPQPLGKATTPSPIRTAILTLPEGFTINPDAADGQSMCTDQEANMGSEGPAACPDKSKIGTFAIGSPALTGPLTGSVYIGEPKPGDQYRLLLTASGFGIHAKFLGSFKPDAKTGRLTVHIEDLPQVPFEDFELHLFSSDRGLMATPTHCTVYAASARFFPWNDKLPDQTSTQHFAIDSGPNGTQCPGATRPFSPRLLAGTSNPAAGAFSDFALKLDRDDGDQFLGDLNFTLPPGFTGDLRGIPYCPEASIVRAAGSLGRAEQASPSCPAASQIGTTNVAAGPGGHPFHAVGKMYLSGPLKGAPLSLAAITPALAGPYDYGVVVVRVALHVDPLTAQVRALSETMPQIIGGIPIRMRSIRVNIDRPNFTINPTNCTPMAVHSQGVGDQGAVTDFSSPFTAVNCATLPFKPRMTITQLGKRKDTKRNRNPALRFDLRTRPGDANLKSVSVTLPTAFAIDQRHLGNICSKAQLEAELCKGRQPIGNAWVKTPLLDEPLSGPAYAVSGFGKLPKVAFILDGQVRIIPQGESSSVKAGKGSSLKTTVPVIPDAPIGHFRLTLLGGKQGYLVNTRDLCIAPARATIDYTAQNGKAMTQRVKAKTVCGGKVRKGKRAKR